MRIALALVAALLALGGPSPATAQQTRCKGTRIWCPTTKTCTYADACPKAKPEPKPKPKPRPRPHARCPADMVEIPTGRFTMGSPEGVGDTDERPARELKLRRYCIDRTEVTRAAYAEFLAAALHRPPPCGWPPGEGEAELPVVCVAHGDAGAFCRWAGKRLPSEGEWERAARGDEAATWPWGEQAPSCPLAIMAGDAEGCAGGGPAPVGSREPGRSPWGLVDAAGNVWEWVADWYLEGELRGLRRGSWASEAAGLRAADRDGERPEALDPTIGFRCAR